MAPAELFIRIFHTPFALLFLTTFLANTVLACVMIVRLKGRERSVFWFSLLLSIVDLWSFALVILAVTDSPGIYAFWYAMTELAVVLVLPAYLCFCLSFVGKDKTLARADSMIPILLPAATLLFLYWKTDWVTIHDFSRSLVTPWGHEYLRGQVPWDLIIITFYMFYALTEMTGYYFKEKDREKRYQIGVVWWAVALPAIGGILFQVVIPVVWKLPEFPVTAPLIFLTCVLIGRALLRYRRGVFALSEISSDIVQVIPESFLTLDRSFVIQTANPSASRLFGIPEDQLVGKPLEDIISSDPEKTSWRQHILEPLAHGQTVENVEAVVPSDKGVKIPVNVRTIVNRDPAGAILRIVMTLTDISVIKAKEQEVFDTVKRTEGQNKLLEENKTAMLNLLEDARELEEELKEQKENVEKKVEERTRELTEKNAALEAAQKQVSEGWIQLQREKARLTASINSLTLGFILTDMQDHIITMNPASLGIIGLSSRPDDLRVVEGLLQSVVDIHKLHEQCHLEQKPIHIESLLFGRKYLRLFLAPIVLFTDKEEHIGTVILIEDISEAKVLERSREEFFSIASHELRTPLTAIRGNTSLIKEHYFEKLDPDMKDMISDIHESSIRLINIVNDFLSMTRLEQQRLDFKKESVDLPSLIRQAIKEYQVTGSRQNIALDFDEPLTPIPAAFADPERVRQVLVNLIGNSLKFTEQGGVKIGVVQVDNMVEVTISDTGRGIAIQNQSLLFHKFQQAGDSLFTRDTTKGTGLGLYISKLMVEAMGGKIWLVKSEPNKGSVFAFTLPIAKKPEEEETAPVAPGVVQEKPPADQPL